jgi:hypothetical protein
MTDDKRISGPPERGKGLATVEAVAGFLNVSCAWVYANAAALGGRRLGRGKRPPLRFRWEDVEAFIENGRMFPPAPAVEAPPSAPRGPTGSFWAARPASKRTGGTQR